MWTYLSFLWVKKYVCTIHFLYYHDTWVYIVCYHFLFLLFKSLLVLIQYWKWLLPFCFHPFLYLYLKILVDMFITCHKIKNVCPKLPSIFSLCSLSRYYCQLTTSSVVISFYAWICIVWFNLDNIQTLWTPIYLWIPLRMSHLTIIGGESFHMSLPLNWNNQIASHQFYSHWDHFTVAISLHFQDQHFIYFLLKSTANAKCPICFYCFIQVYPWITLY